MLARVVTGSFAAALVLLVWGFAFWVGLPFQKMVLRPLPQEEAVLRLLTETVPRDGAYVFPERSAEPAAEQRMRDGPIGMVVLRRQGSDPQSLAPYLLGFLHLFVSALLVAGVLALAGRGLPTFAGRFLCVFLVGLFAGFSVEMSDVVWMQHPPAAPVMMLVFHAAGWLLAAFPLAAIVRPRT